MIINRVLYTIEPVKENLVSQDKFFFLFLFPFFVAERNPPIYEVITTDYHIKIEPVEIILFRLQFLFQFYFVAEGNPLIHMHTTQLDAHITHSSFLYTISHTHGTHYSQLHKNILI